jgi:putative membrane protein
MTYFIVNWALGSSGLFALAAILPGFRITELYSALLAAGVVALLHASISSVFKPSLGDGGFGVSAALLLMVDTFTFRVVALLVPGFAMLGLAPAFAGAVLLFGMNMVLPRLIRVRRPAVAVGPSIDPSPAP